MAVRLTQALRVLNDRFHDQRALVDLVLACLLGVLASADAAASTVGGGQQEPDLLAYMLILTAAVALVWRRRFPVTVLAVVVTASSIFWLGDNAAFLALLGLPALYAVAAHAENRRRAWIAIAAGAMTLLVVAGVTVLNPEEGFNYFDAMNMSAFLAGAVAAGVVIRNRERIFVDTQRRADMAEADRIAEAQRAVALERSRIAREMHDVVAHGMSVIAVQAAAAQEIAHTDPDKTVEVLSRIENVGRESLSEMRRMLGVLRSGDDSDVSLTPQPTLSDVAEAVAQSVESGVATELVVEGDERVLAAGVELAAFRIVQEALTNVRKHAGRLASATVRLGYGEDALTIEVSDDGVGATTSLSSSGGGHGLIGMRERVEIYGGDFSAGPETGGGYLVRVMLPVADSGARPGVTSASLQPATPASNVTS